MCRHRDTDTYSEGRGDMDNGVTDRLVTDNRHSTHVREILRCSTGRKKSLLAIQIVVCFWRLFFCALCIMGTVGVAGLRKMNSISGTGAAIVFFSLQ